VLWGKAKEFRDAKKVFAGIRVGMGRQLRATGLS